MVFKQSKELHKTKDTEDKPFHVLYLGENGFPEGFGAIQKMIMVSKSLIREGAKVTIINRKGKFDPAHPKDLPTQGTFQGIHYVYTSGTIYRPSGFLSRNFQKLRGSWNELKYLRQLRRENHLDVAIVSCYSFTHVLLYRLYAYWLGFPIVYNYVEMARVLDSRTSVKEKINDYLFEKILIPAMDGAFPISDVLIQQFEKLAPGKPFLKLPILCEFEKFDVESPKPNREYFLYCGAISYRRVIDFVLKAFDQLEDRTVDLHLVLGGRKEELADLQDFIRGFKKASQVKVFLNVNHGDIPKHYKPAKALLIPMRPTLQDAARFPHKIGEYVASGNPMISCNYGEVKSYFKDGETALVAKDYDPVSFAAKMQFVLDHPQEAKAIGERGKALGLEVFNHTTYGRKLLDFFKKLK